MRSSLIVIIVLAISTSLFASDISSLIKDLGTKAKAKDASEALAKIGKPAVPALIEALKDKDRHRGRYAARALRQMGQDAADAIPALSEALDDADVETRDYAVEALGNMTQQANRVITILQSATNDKNKDIKEKAVLTIAKLTKALESQAAKDSAIKVVAQTNITQSTAPLSDGNNTNRGTLESNTSRDTSILKKASIITAEQSDGQSDTLPIVSQKSGSSKDIVHQDKPSQLGTLTSKGFNTTQLLLATIVLATAIWAAIDAQKLEWRKYKTSLARSPITLFIVIILIWIVAFPWYLWQRSKIKSDEAELRDEYKGDLERTKKGKALYRGNLEEVALTRANPSVAKTGMRVCENCERAIGELEQTHIHNSYMVCGECYTRLSQYRTGPNAPAVNVNIRNLGTDLAGAVYQTKSYVSRALLTFVLYWFGFFIIGFIANILYLSDANKVRRVIGRSPPGRGFLLFILWFHIIGIILIIVAIGFIASAPP